MSHKIRIIVAVLISWVPVGALRKLLYRIFLRYRFARSSRVGWRTLIAVKSFEAGESVQIGPFNSFKGPIRVKMEKNSRIGRGNRFLCPWILDEARFADRGYDPRLHMSEGALFMDRHEVDLFGSVTLGQYSWFGGAGSQLWTHGLSVNNRNIVIGDRNYIGASTRFAPGTGLGDDNIVALGSVILNNIDRDACLIAGSPAQPVRSIREELEAGRYHRSFDDF